MVVALSLGQPCFPESQKHSNQLHQQLFLKSYRVLKIFGFLLKYDKRGDQEA